MLPRFLRGALRRALFGAPRPVIILGMHRSGTSCLAGCLEDCGLYLGAGNPGVPDNPRGNRENPGIMELQNQLLALNGGKWSSPPNFALVWPPELEARREELIAGYPANRIWGFKDPRTLLTLDAWLSSLPAARLVGSVRHPWLVARSLNERNRMPLAEGVDLWLAYNRRLLQACRERPVALISFDSPADVYRARVDAIADRVGLPRRTSDGDFFESNLRHHADPGTYELPPEAARVYAELIERLDE